MKNNQYTATPNWFKDATTSQTGSQVGQQVTNYYIQGGSSSGGTIDISQVWEALAADTTEQVNKSHLTDALTGYVTEQWITDQGFINKEETSKFVTTDTEQDITGIKSFVNGLKISDKLINIVDGILYLDCNVAVTGGLTVYAQGTQDVPSIWEGAPFDNITIHYNEETKLIEVIGGVGGIDSIDITGSGNAITSVSLTNDGKSLTFDKGETFATITELNTKWTQDDDKILSWDNAASKAHEHANKTTLDKIYEKDGVIYWDGSLAVTGGITSYALGDVEVSTIMDGVTVDGTTIAKVDGVLKVLNAGGGEAGSVAWENVTNKPSWIGITKPSYNWSEIGSKPNTLSGYGITDAYTKTDSDNRFVNVSGDTITGDLFIQRIAIGSSNEINSADRLYLAYRDTPQGINVCHNNTPFTYGSANHTIWHAGNDGVGSGLDADLLDGLHGNSFFRESLLAKQNLDANNLDTYYVQYTPIGDMNTWDGTSFTNFPKSKPAGGFSLLVLGEGNYRKQIYSDYNDNHLYTRTQYYSNGIKWNNWSTVALTTDNVASATKLQTARTIWGQPFNGEQNIRGEIRDAGSIQCIGPNGGAYLYAGIRSGEAFSIEVLNSAGVWQTQGITLLLNGNVGIGTVAPGFKLDVNGTTNANTYTFRLASSSDVCWGIDNDRISAGVNVARGVNVGSLLVSNHWSDFTNLPTNGIWCKGNIISNSEIQAHGWVRTFGNVGWYNETYGGGWYMTDTNWIRSYNNQSIYTAGAMQAGNGFETSNANILRFINYTHTSVISWSWDNTYGDCITFSIPGTNPQEKFMKLSHNRGLDLSGNFIVSGNILATGGITAYQSDRRAKTVIENINLSLKQIANAPTVRFKWNNWRIKDDGKTHIGGIAQYTQMLLPEAVLEADNALNMDYATTGYIFAVQTARHLQTYETRTDKKIRKLEKEVLYLKKQLKKLGYEEANIMDD